MGLQIITYCQRTSRATLKHNKIFSTFLYLIPFLFCFFSPSTLIYITTLSYSGLRILLSGVPGMLQSLVGSLWGMFPGDGGALLRLCVSPSHGSSMNSISNGNISSSVDEHDESGHAGLELLEMKEEK